MTAADKEHSLSPLVHILDDDQAVLESLALLISTVGLRVHTWSDPQLFYEQLNRDDIGVIVMDVRMPGMSGLSLLDKLSTERVDIPIIMLTGHGTVDMCRRAFKAGAMEFLEKPIDDELLLETVQTAVRAHIQRRERLTADVQSKHHYETLSEREKEVLKGIVDGLSNKAIARQLDLSPRTVETHRANIFNKLHVDNLAHLIRQYADLLNPLH